MNVTFKPQRTHIGRWKSVVNGLASVALAFLFTLSIQAVMAQPEAAEKFRLNKNDRDGLEAMLTTHLQRLVDRQKRLEGQGSYIKVKSVKYDARARIIYLDLGNAYVPRRHSFEFLESLRELNIEVSDVVWDSIPLDGVRFLYDGKDIYHYFPDEPRQPKPSTKKNADVNATAIPLIVVSAGHGAYYHYGSPTFGAARWTEQRDPANGIVEDNITPGYAIELSNWLLARSDVTTAFARSFSEAIHTPSDRPWWKVAARYHLATLYPDNTNIWNSRPNDTDSERERKEDLQSRPYLANHLGASTLLHVHTNGVTNPAARGTRVYFQTGRTADKPLADSILCYMRELIHAQPAYINFPIAPTTGEDDNAETRLATMPTVVVETAFHSNPDDALALQDPLFRTATMKGVEKGYRLNAAGKTTCEPFKIDSIPNVSGPQNTNIPANIDYSGYPQFSVKRKTEIIGCASGWSCRNYNGTYRASVPTPLTFSFRCSVSSPKPAATFRWRTTLTDVDGVVTNSVEHTSTCTTPVTAASDTGRMYSGKPTVSTVSN